MIRRDFLSLGVATLATTTLPVRTAAAVAPTTLPAALTTMLARMADDVCDSYMVSTKLFYKNSVYGYTDAVVNLLKDLGVRIVRERLMTGTSIGTSKQKSAMIALAKSGCRWHATIGTLPDWRNATAVNRNAMNILSSYLQAEGRGQPVHPYSLLGWLQRDQRDSL
ncbi:hypothetical protein BH24ACT12_BH24ACT12_16140 [soil metagenome]